MNITQRDVMLLFTMALAVVSMSMVFPSLGLGGEEVAENEIPELTVNSSRFDFADTFPAAPGSPRTEDLTWDDSRDDQYNQIWLDGDTSGGTEIALLPPETSSSSGPQTIVNKWDAGSVTYTETQNYTAAGDTGYFYNESIGYELQFEALTVDDTNGIYEVRMTVRQEIGSSGWLSNVPVLGTAVDVGAATAATLGWFVEIAIWAITYLFTLIANGAGLAADIGIYLVTLLMWLITTYASIVGSAGSWVAVFVALPGILLSAVLAKFVIIGAGLLPTT